MPPGCLTTSEHEFSHAKLFCIRSHSTREYLAKTLAREVHWQVVDFSGFRHSPMTGQDLFSPLSSGFINRFTGQVHTSTMTGFDVAGNYLRFMCAPTVLIAPGQCNQVGRPCQSCCDTRGLKSARQGTMCAASLRENQAVAALQPLSQHDIRDMEHP